MNIQVKQTTTHPRGHCEACKITEDGPRPTGPVFEITATFANNSPDRVVRLCHTHGRTFAWLLWNEMATALAQLAIDTPVWDKAEDRPGVGPVTPVCDWKVLQADHRLGPMLFTTGCGEGYGRSAERQSALKFCPNCGKTIRLLDDPAPAAVDDDPDYTADGEPGDDPPTPAGHARRNAYNPDNPQGLG